MTAHVHCFEAMAGYPQIVVCDNLRSAVTRPHRYEPDVNATFAEMAARYGVAIMPARAYKPRDKAKARGADRRAVDHRPAPRPRVLLTGRGQRRHPPVHGGDQRPAVPETPPRRTPSPRLDRGPGSPAAATWPPGPGAPRWTISPESARARPGPRRATGNLSGLLGETAVAAGKTQTREGARYRRLSRRRGKAKALVAVGNTQMKACHALLSHPGARYTDLGPDYYDRQRGTRRQIARHVGRLGALGFEVTLCRLPDPDPCQAASTPAA